MTSADDSRVSRGVILIGCVSAILTGGADVINGSSLTTDLSWAVRCRLELAASRAKMSITTFNVVRGCTGIGAVRML